MKNSEQGYVLFLRNSVTRQKMQELVTNIMTSQKLSGLHVVTKACEQMQESVRSICHQFHDTQIMEVQKHYYDNDYLTPQASSINCCHFGAVGRADDMLLIKIEILGKIWMK